MEIEHPSLSDKVYEYLSNQIIDGSIKYGEKLNIKAISQQLKVSTMPVRDALKKLEMENIVQIKPRSNCIVTVPTQKSILDAIAMRELLETHALKAVYRTISPEQIAFLSKIIDNMATIALGRQSRGKIKQYIHLDHLFHTKLCALSGNEYLQKFYREVNLHLNMTFTYQISIPPDIRATFEDHKGIVELLGAHSPEALQLMKRHLERSKSNVVHGQLFRSLGQ